MAIIIDETDPCAAAAQLRQIYLSLISGQSESEVRFRAGQNGVERQVRYHAANVTDLRKYIEGLESRCAQINGRRPRRFGIATGGRY